MPFKSEKQRRFLWARHPEIARRWSEEEKKKRRKAQLGKLKERNRRGKG